jgi:hypothetical protein
MRSTRVAEWILSQVTSRERAEAVIGDLLEKVPSRGALWFWWSVVATTFALVWRDVAAHPMRMLGLVFAGVLVQFALMFLLIFVAATVFGIVALANAMDLQHLIAWFSHGWSTPLMLATWSAMALIQFQVGRWLAKRSPDHELVPCVVFSIVGLTVSLAWSLSFSQPGALHVIWAGVSPVLYTVFDLPLYAGAVSMRRKRLAAP